MRAISEGTFDPPRTLRPELPEGLEAIVLRAMHVSPRRRFESIHALGQRLWEFASPRGQAQWKTFYFHTPAAGQAAAKTATFIDRIGPARREAAHRIDGVAGPGLGAGEDGGPAPAGRDDRS